MASAVDGLLRQGFTLEEGTETSAILIKMARVNHVLHAILSLLTLGLWLVIWLAITAGAKTVRVRLWLDSAGQVQRQLI